MSAPAEIDTSGNRVTPAQARKAVAEAASEFEADGYSAHDIFLKAPGCMGYTYDDLILMPGQIRFGVGDVKLETQLTRNIRLKTPLASSPIAFVGSLTH